jgi:ketosteroid isomerase-like protein
MVRRACQAWCDGDISVYREMYTEDVVAEGGGMWPEGEGSEQGVERLISNLESIMAAFERSELIPESFHEHGDAMLAGILWRGVLPGGDAPIEQRVVCAYRFRDGLIAYTAWFPGLEEAAAALGIELDADGTPAEGPG